MALEVMLSMLMAEFEVMEDFAGKVGCQALGPQSMVFLSFM